MIKFKYLLCLVPAILLACQEDSLLDPSQSGNITVNASLTGNHTRTEMSAQDGSSYHVLWSEGEEILIGATSNFTTFSIESGVGTTLAQFTGPTPAKLYGDFLAAVYPSTGALAGVDDDCIHVGAELSDSQTYIPGSFAKDLAPMASVSEGGELYQFHNLYSVLQLPIQGKGTLRQIEILGNRGDEKLAGGIEMCFSKTDGMPVASERITDNGMELRSIAPVKNSIVMTFGEDGLTLSETDPVKVNIVLLPGTLEDGFTLNIKDMANEAVFTKTAAGALDFKRSFVKRMKAFDYASIEPLEFDVDVEPWNGEDGDLVETVYKFSLQNSKDGYKQFENTIDDAGMVSIPVISTKAKKTAPDDTSAWPWSIKSYRIGTGAPVTVDNDTFTDGFFQVSKNGDNVEVTSLRRDAVYKGSNNYWRNIDGISGDTDGTGWSPADWTTATASNAIDLSRFDFRTEVQNGPMNTANCYIIRHAGTYRLPLVYGNGIKNGEVNGKSYYPNIGGDIIDAVRTVDDPEDATRTVVGNYRLERFLNHLGNGISSPYIEENSGCEAASAAVIWQERDRVIDESSLSIVPGEGGLRYLQFTVDNEKVCQNNAIIAVKDDSGDVIWSWHIWTTNDPTLLQDPIPVINNSYHFFPIFMLGWIEPAVYPENEIKMLLVQKRTGSEIEITLNQKYKKYSSIGSLYQWGRKDPMPPYNVVSGNFQIMNAPVDLATAIRNPDTFYKGTVYWHGTRYYNLWSGKKSVAGEYDWDSFVTKTVYDPSPAGYQVPTSGSFAPFVGKTLLDEPNSVRGYSICFTDINKNNTIIFPIGGFRQYNGTFGHYSQGGEDGQYLTVNTGGGYDTKTAHYYKAFLFGCNNVVLQKGYNYHNRGHYVRPILER